jgi:phosphatidylglycerophosphate synthase
VITALISEFKSSIKSPDTEEKLDLVLYRPCGYLIAKIAHLFGMTPSMLSLMGLGFGVLSAFYFFEVRLNQAFAYASFYFILSGILDSADGQLARLSNQSSKIGLILDGICDSLVTIAVYAACAWPFIKVFGPVFIFVVALALYLHSCQCAILDFYHREYLYFGYGKTGTDTYWNPTMDEAVKHIVESDGRWERWTCSLRLTWVKKQVELSTRTDAERLAMRAKLLQSTEEEKREFMDLYKKHNLWLLPFWRLVGVNAHTILILFFMYLQRFDIYLIVFDLIVLNLIIYVVNIFQKKSDEKFMTEIRLNLNAY